MGLFVNLYNLKCVLAFVEIYIYINNAVKRLFILLVHNTYCISFLNWI